MNKRFPLQLLLMGFFLVAGYSFLISPARVAAAQKTQLTKTARTEDTEAKKMDLEYREPRPPEVSLVSVFFRSLVSLALIILLIYLSVWGLRLLYRSSRLPVQGGASMHLLETFPLSPQRTLYLLACGGKVYLIAFAEKGVAKIDEWTEEGFKEKFGAYTEFAQKLKQWEQRMAGESASSPLEKIENRLRNLWEKPKE